MRHPVFLTLCVSSAFALSACQKANEAEVERAVQDVIASDENSMNAIMMTVADPNEAVAYFKRESAEQPNRIDFKRGLARSLIRARRYTEATSVWSDVISHPEVTNEDRVNYADALIRSGNWDRAEAVLDTIPPTHETYNRYRLEAMVADANKEWKRADSFYETAVGLTTRPAAVMNNWGYSKLTRRDFSGAERLFTEAITYDRDLFTAKNNLVLSRGAQRNYQMPILEVSQIERAQLYHTLALAAIKNGDVAIGKGLLEEAVDTHPQHFEEASRALAALQANVTN
ncbi:Flp pilus assembly protein TadD [Rhodovulum iodosum]|uniref:Flp pilus assembly protein TadD n=1 Tax=Rhodovulum iodosum TaxID=68291 RepID=A0ABV3XY13_9RHOB|nr:tetratricopeptide repeat protein [Rhodovulum robiginosum]RSK36770.1 tetratricopeptide repeat protein [Rhodovulum robiginosum]